MKKNKKIKASFGGYSSYSLLDVVKSISSQLKIEPKNLDLDKIIFEFDYSGCYYESDLPEIMFEYKND